MAKQKSVILGLGWAGALVLGLMAMISVARAQSYSATDMSLPPKLGTTSTTTTTVSKTVNKKLSKQPLVQFKQAELMEVAQVLTRISDRRFIFEGGIKGKTTILSSSAITSEDLYKAFLNALALNGYSVDESNGFIRVYSARSVARGNHDFIESPSQIEQEKVVTWVYKFKQMSAADFARDYADVLSKDGEYNVNSASNSVVFTDFTSSLKRVEKLLAQIDVATVAPQPVAVPPAAEAPVASTKKSNAAVATPIANPSKPEEFKAVEESTPEVNPNDKVGEKFEVRAIEKPQESLATTNLEKPREVGNTDALSLSPSAEPVPGAPVTQDKVKLDLKNLEGTKPALSSGASISAEPVK